MPAFTHVSPRILLAFAIAVAVVGCTGASDTGTAPTATNASTPAAGLQITDTKIGTGFTPKPGQTCIVHYTGWPYENGTKGKKFDSSVDRKTPFSFVLGEHKVIDGWERGRQHHEGWRQAHAHHTAVACLWFGWRGCGHPTECDVALRDRASGCKGLATPKGAPPAGMVAGETEAS